MLSITLVYAREFMLVAEESADLNASWLLLVECDGMLTIFFHLLEARSPFGNAPLGISDLHLPAQVGFFRDLVGPNGQLRECGQGNEGLASKTWLGESF
jgi:hypothetical protein